ncbi:hypothetical protein HFP67_28080 [Bacillus sp. CB102A.1]
MEYALNVPRNDCRYFRGFEGWWAYVPLDPTYPEQRLQYILEDASIQLFVTQESLKRLKWLPENVESICLDRDQDEIGKESKTLPLSNVVPKIWHM